MPAVPVNAPSSTTTSNGVDFEPDDAWKDELRKRIEEGFQSMVADKKDNYASELSKAPDTPEVRRLLDADYNQATQTIRGLALEQYKLELDRERNQRRWMAGIPMAPGWTQYFRQEQQDIMNSIKQSNQIRTATGSPTEERRSAIPKPCNELAAFAPTTPVPLPVPPTPPVRPREEREKPFVSPYSVRRGSDVRSTLSDDRRDDSGSFGRSHHASVRERPGLPDNWVATEDVEEPEETLRSPPQRRAQPSSIQVGKPSQPSTVSPDNRWDNSLGTAWGSIHSAEHLARSPPRAPPEVWKPAISPAEDALPAKHYNLGSRGSPTSMRSTRSGASIRPSITETISEWADDEGSDESAIEENDYDRAQETTEQGRTTRISMDKSPEKEKRPHVRTSRQFLVDPGLRSDNLGSSSMKSDDGHRPIDSPGKPPPYYDYREQSSSSRDNYSHRDQQVPSLDPSPIPARSSYGDERDYGLPHGPKSPPYHPQRESRPISRQTSFTRQPYVDLDDNDNERDRGRDRERHRDREYYRKEEDAQKKEEEMLRMEEVKRKEEDAARKTEEAKKVDAIAKEADAKRKEEEYWIKEEDVKRREEEATRKAEELSRREEEAKQREELFKKKVEEAHIKIKKMENILRQREEELTRREGGIEARRLRDLEYRNQNLEVDDELKRTEPEIQQLAGEEARKKREEYARIKEEEILRMEEDVKKKEEGAARKAEKAKKMEAVVMKKEADAKRKEKEVRSKHEDAKRKEEVAMLKEEEATRKAEELSKKDIEMKERESMLRRREEAFMRREADSIRREQEARKRQGKALAKNEAKARQDEEIREEEVTSPAMSKSPQFNGPLIPKRSPSTGGWDTGSAPVWSPSIKPTAAAVSLTSRSSASTAIWIPKTGSVSSGTYPTSSSPHTASFSETERTRKQQEFTESQQEQFRRAQENLEAERRLKSAGRPLFS